MKFKFEKAKNSVKKIVVGAGVVASSIGNLEAQEIKTNPKEVKIDKSEIVNITSENKDLNSSEFYRNEYLKYMEHPSYKKRLAREMYGDEVINEEKQKAINAEYEKRLSAIKNIPIEIMPNTQDAWQDSSYYSTAKKSIKATPRAIYHELSHSLDHVNNFIIKQNGFENVKSKYLSDSVLYFYYDYLSGKSEIKARLNSLRFKAMKMYGFDLGDDFDINNYEKLREDEEYKDLRFNLQLTNEQINELMKYVAINENNNTNKNYYHPEWNYGGEENIT